MKLTHIDEEGKARMVDVSGKEITLRQAKAYGCVKMSKSTYELLKRGEGPKGDILGTARLAGIMAAKKTHELVPLCHPLLLSHVEIEFSLNDVESALEIESTVKCEGKTGVEMECLTAVLVSALTVYDMLKAVDKRIVLGPFYLIEKEGGKSGRFVR